MRLRYWITSALLIFMLGSLFHHIQSTDFWREAAKSRGDRLKFSFKKARPYFRNNDSDATVIEKKAGFRLAGNSFEAKHEFEHDNPELDLKNAARAAGKEASKKKKKKKKASTAAEISTTKSKNNNYKDSDNNNVSDVANNNFTGGTGLVGAQNTLNEQEDLRTKSEWERRLLSRPDRSETLKFIQAYQAGLVIDQDFYELTQKMYDQSRLEFKELAITAWGATPSIQSFTLLSNVGNNSNAGGSAASLANRELSGYESINLIWVTRAILIRNFDAVVVRTAARVLDSSTQRYLTSETRTPSSSPESEATTTNQTRTMTTAETLRVFSGLIPVIENAIIRYGSDPEISEPLRAALTRIQNASQNLNLPPASQEQ
jgi:hypothetical protein